MPNDRDREEEFAKVATTIMSYQTKADNIFPEGTLITAKENPSLNLKIMKYNQRIYYCAIVGDESKKPLVYFERELIPPASKK
jgi:hypothetical protein